ncbi:MAG TPA: DUF2147 domain-containing protein [Clostridia bacterium]|nr:DUF2147 domain-containing protein [Clostridia bacterium]
MKRIVSVLRLGFLLSIVAALTLPILAQDKQAQLQAAIGLWQVIDDKTGKPNGQVETYLDKGKLYGKITALRPSRTQDAKCDKCTGELKDKPILGLVFLSGFSPDNDGWSGGTVVDPENGKTYRGKIKAIGADKLQLRGYVGIPLLGRTETWVRLTPPSH